jgi:hypothetical protein
MMPIAVFTISGLAIVILIVTKGLGEKRKKPFFVMRAISMADVHIRRLYHLVVHFYSEGKEEALLFFKKRVGMYSRNSFNKILSFLREKREYYMGNIRDPKLLKKPEGISEFIKNMSNIEKGNGEINEVYEDGSQEDKKEVR